MVPQEVLCCRETTTFRLQFARFVSSREPAASPRCSLVSNLLAMLEAGCRGRLARRNVNTGRPISLIGPIRSNARHSPAHIASRKARLPLYAPGSGHCSCRYVCIQYARTHTCTCTLMLRTVTGMR